MFNTMKEFIREQRLNAIVKAYKRLLKATTKLPEYQWEFSISISSDNKLYEEREALLDRMLSGNEKYGFRDRR